MKKRFLIFTTIILTSIFTFLFFAVSRQNLPASTGKANKTINLTGDEAIEYLKKDGSYDSFAEAYTTARYSFAENKTNPNDFYANNEAHGFRADFDERGVKISTYETNWKFDWQLKSIGRGANQTALESGETQKKGQRVEIAKSEIRNPNSKILTEWFQNQPDGLEQGFIVHEKPNGDEKLRLILTTDSIAKATDNGQSLELSNKENGKIMRYENLKVWDAENKVLAAAMSVTDAGEIFLEVEDERAVYPVTIDPKFVQIQKIDPPQIPDSAGFGNSIAVSGDRMIVGAPNADNTKGTAFYFTRNSNVWTLVTTLVDSNNNQDFYGSEVAIDGNIAVITAPGRNSGKGAAFVWRLNISTINAAQTLTAPDSVNQHYFGESVAVQGNTILVGATGGDDRQGVYVFRDPGINAFIFRKKLVPSDSNDLNGFGRNISYSGNTVAVSTSPGLLRNAPNANGGGEGNPVYVFAGSDTSWTQQARITAPSQVTGNFGVSLDVEGDYLIIGEPGLGIGGGGNIGRAHIYSRNGTFWVFQKTLNPAAGAGTISYGVAVAITNGLAAVTDPSYNDFRGVVYIYTGSGNNWRERQKIQATNAAPELYLGDRICLDNGTIFTSGEFGSSGSFSVYGFQLNPTVPADFDGDGKSDISLFRPSNSVWYIRQSQSTNVASTQFGISTDIPVDEDFDGDGKTDVAVWRASNGVWYGIFSATNTYQSFQFGQNGDKPVPGDYDGDGVADLAVFRPSTGTWYWQNSSTGEYSIEAFGVNGDVPVQGDYDGDGITDKAIFRPSNGQWWMARSALGTIAATFGISSDKPVPADFTDDGKTDVAFYRPASGEWFVLRSEDYSYYAFPFGLNTDIPAPGDYDGDGAADAAIFRQSNGVWYLQQSNLGFTSVPLGQNGDKPIPGLPN